MFVSLAQLECGMASEDTQTNKVTFKIILTSDPKLPYRVYANLDTPYSYACGLMLDCATAASETSGAVDGMSWVDDCMRPSAALSALLIVS